MNVALYIRLSLADEDTGFSKVESDSIGSQRMCLNSYLDNSDFLNHNRLEFVDDGHTATNGNRPSFIKMMDKVQAGEIKTIIVRDFSRFFRDYIEAGNYLECVFPFLDVRFISINDNYDSNDYKGTTGGLEMVMRNIVYASYSKDLSIKTTTAKVNMMKQGKYVGGYAPYGYKMHDTIKHKLAIDIESAKVIRMIFDEALNGEGTLSIARKLNDNKILTPAQYFKSINPNTNKFKGISQKVNWTHSAIHKVIKNQLYTGAMVSHRRKSAGLGTRQTLIQEPIIVEDMHEAIVTKEEFAKANLVIKDGAKGVKRTALIYPLKTLVKCGNCNRALTRQTRKNIDNIFKCGNSKLDLMCSTNIYKEKMLENIAYNAISEYIAIFRDKSFNQLNQKSNLYNIVSELSSLDAQIESLKNYKVRLYENYTTGELTKELFLKQKLDTDVKINDIETGKAELENQLQALQSNDTSNISNINDLVDIFDESATLTYEMAHSFIKAIYIHDENNIEIVWKFDDLFEEV